MGAHSTMTMKRALEVYNGFDELSSIVNAGGGNGVTLDMIISKYPSIHGINFDLPEVIKVAPTYNGIEHVAGDMFVEVPKGDAILLKFVLHNWDDNKCLKLLENCYKALTDKGKVIVMDAIYPEDLQPDNYSKFVAQLDVIMFANFGGKERTQSEFEALANGAGFAEFKVMSRAYGTWIMEFVK
ncbi:caffeic acid 3-O-methyltransferase-like [Primulina huaijiensis]